MLAARDSIIVLKPLTYMNASGQAVLAVARKHMIPAENIVVVCDDLYIEKGKIRISSGGSGGGHNGLKSVTELLGTADYKRVRVGIMPAQKPDNQKDYVLSRIEPADAAIFETAISNAAEAVWEIIHGGKFEIVQGKFNAKNAKSDGAK
jgi:PTH1 family peptidyl-tRNA hydrolase